VRLAIAALAALFVGLALFEVTMQPSGSERLELAAIFGIMAGLMVLAGAIVPRLARRSSRLVVSLFVVSVASIGIAVLGVVIAANRMFFNDHDLTLLLVVLGFGLVAAVGFAALASSALTMDLQRMAHTAHRVSEGDLGARTGVERGDEVGALANDIDAMAARLEDAHRRRLADEMKRREFFAAVGHDLRTPLASMQAAVEALQDGVATDTGRYYGSLERDIAALHALVDDVFLLARLQAGDLTLERVPTDLSDLADEAMEVLAPVARRKDVTLVIDARARPVVETEPSAVSRVLRNLLDNAIRHAPERSTVRIVVDQGDGCTVSVRDHGPGFGADFVDVAFESFTREDASRTRGTGGAGLGLAIAHGFVDALDGDIWVEPGPGGCVTFRLP
jgi:signal transduction histidine kinase